MNALPLPTLATVTEDRLRAACVGVVPLSARLEPWMLDCFSGNQLQGWLQRYGSPLNLLCLTPLERNLRKLNTVATDRGLDFRVYFARKANKCLRLIDALDSVSAGVDTASLTELNQVLNRGLPASRLICTAAIKDSELLDTCVRHGVTVVIDNADELQALCRVARTADRPPRIALRVSGFRTDPANAKLHSRFGIDIDHLSSFVQRYCRVAEPNCPRVVGLHFHLHGGSAGQRVAAITQLLPWIDVLRHDGHPIEFLDIGGGFPMNYQASQTQWERFWQEHDRALLGNRSEITYRNHGFGRLAVNQQVHGTANVYPYHYGPLQADWLADILDTVVGRQSLGESIRQRNVQLRCEPGRSVLDGCGMTVARVEYEKQHIDGHSLLGLAMNRTQCRTTDDDFMVDPILLRQVSEAECRPPSAFPPSAPRADQSGIREGYLVGAYCAECELISLRRMRFPQGVSRGDLFVFPNTAGYWMHFMESRSHQFPLAKNLFVSAMPGSEVLLEEQGRGAAGVESRGETP